MRTHIIRLPLESVSDSFRHDIDELAKSVFDHPAMRSRFYLTWRKRRLSLQDFQIFATNYFRRVYATTQRIAFAVATISDWESRIELLHNLSDELGHGKAENVHVLVLYRWLDSLNKALGSKESFRSVLETISPLPQTEIFIEETNKLCQIGPQQASGALLAQEWHGYTQIAYLFEGFRNYQPLFEFEEFHDVSEYFYVHLGRAEKEHKKQASLIAARHCHSHSELVVISQSFRRYMDLLSAFWDGIADSLSIEQETVSDDVVNSA